MHYSENVLLEHDADLVLQCLGGCSRVNLRRLLYRQMETIQFIWFMYARKIRLWQAMRCLLRWLVGIPRYGCPAGATHFVLFFLFHVAIFFDHIGKFFLDIIGKLSLNSIWSTGILLSA